MSSREEVLAGNKHLHVNKLPDNWKHLSKSGSLSHMDLGKCRHGLFKTLPGQELLQTVLRRSLTQQLGKK